MIKEASDSSPTPVRRVVRWSVFAVVLLTLILVPFFLFGAAIEEWTRTFLDVAHNRPWTTSLVLGGLLASDILLPVPSSIASTACGSLLGFVGGTLTSFVGMTISCAIGFLLGRLAGGSFGRKFVGESELRRMERLHERFGVWIVAIARPVPVLAEASVLLAGMGKMSWGRFFVMSTLANLGISVVYAAAGSFASDINSFLFAFAASLCLPGIAMLAWRKRG